MKEKGLGSQPGGWERWGGVTGRETSGWCNSLAHGARGEPRVSAFMERRVRHGGTRSRGQSQPMVPIIAPVCPLYIRRVC